MSYAWDITIPANTLATAVVEQTLHVHPGVLVKAEIKFPSGCHGMVRARLFWGRFQIVPLSRGQWVTGDDEPVSFPTYFPVKGEPAELVFQGCSPGTTYQHVVTVRLSVLPEKVATWIPFMELLTKVFQRMGLTR